MICLVQMISRVTFPAACAALARVSEPNGFRLTTTRERLTVFSPDPPPLGAGILYYGKNYFNINARIQCSD